MQYEAGVAILRRAEHASTETGGRFTHTIICSISVLQIKEKHNNGKKASGLNVTANRSLVNMNSRECPAV